jgi:hypothetical protein
MHDVDRWHVEDSWLGTDARPAQTSLAGRSQLMNACRIATGPAQMMSVNGRVAPNSTMPVLM